MYVTLNIFKPLKDTIKIYNRSFFISDLIAATTIAVLAIPQSMAYASLAEIDPVYGIYSAIVVTIIASLLSSSSHTIGGPTNASCLLIYGSLISYVTLSHAQYYNVVLVLTFLVGVIQILFGLLNLGRLLNYISKSVITGFTIGASFLIIFGQINKIFGISLQTGLFSFQKIIYVLTHLNNINIYTIFISVLTISLILILNKINNRIPSSLIAMIFTSFIVYRFNLNELGVALTRDAAVKLPSFNMFSINLNLVLDLLPSALSIALIGLIETISISKSIAHHSNEKIDNNQEFFSRGISNLLGSFFNCFLGSASLGRSALNYFTGAKTRFSGILSGIILSIGLILLGNYIKYIPSSALAAIIILTALKMIRFKEIIQLFKTSKKDFITAVITLSAVIIFPQLDKAVLLGIGVSIFIYLYENGTSNIKILHHVPSNNSFLELPIEDLTDEENLIVIQLEGNLYFGLAYDLDEKLELLMYKSNIFILNFRRVFEMDLTAYEIIKTFSNQVKENDGYVLMCEVSDKLYEFLEKNDYFKIYDDSLIFKKESQLFASFFKAYEKSIELLKTN